MKDNISLIRSDFLHPKWKSDAQTFITECEMTLGIVLRITQGLRTFAEQQAIYDQGRTNSGPIVTKAKPGQSLHQYGLAVDLVRMTDGKADWNYDMAALLPFAEKYNIEWGGLWKSIKDFPHWQNSYGLNWRDMLAKYEAKDFILGTQFINI